MRSTLSIVAVCIAVSMFLAVGGRAAQAAPGQAAGHDHDAAAATGSAQGQAAQAPQPGAPTQAAPAGQDMMKMREQMMAEMKAQDAKLDGLVKEMNAARGDARIAALMAVVNELATQHKSMHGRMADMQEMMGGRGMMRGR